jgi:signal transduction histidine kinase
MCEMPVELKHLGFTRMRERARSSAGGFSLVSTPGRGTAVEVVLRA